MAYQNLVNFRYIFNSEDFNYISENANIKKIIQTILYGLPNSAGNESAYIEILESYLQNLYNFCEKTGLKNTQGYLITSKVLASLINLLGEPSYKRKAISRGYLKKFRDLFLFGLSTLLTNIRESYDPDYLGKTNITTEQIVNYIFDTVEGLGNKFLFNRIGQHSFVNKISTLNKNELVATLRLLLRPGNQVRTIDGWSDRGLGKALVRVLTFADRKISKKPFVFFLYKVNEHALYEKQLMVPPTKTAFEALRI